jgi:hypothetical protein
MKSNILILSLLMTFTLSNGWSNGKESGGGTDPGPGVAPRWVNRDEVHFVVWSARHLLYVFFKMRQAEFPELFSNPAHSILTVLESHAIFLPKSGSCFDANGTPATASFKGDAPNTICLSPEWTQQSVLTSDIVEIVAMIAHEYTHLVTGLDEATPKSVQVSVRNKFKYSDGSHTLTRPGMSYITQYSFTSDIQYLIDLFSNVNASDVKASSYLHRLTLGFSPDLQFDILRDLEHSLNSQASGFSFRPVVKAYFQDNDYYRMSKIVGARGRNANYGNAALISSVPQLAKDFQGYLDIIYGSSETTHYCNLAENFPDCDPNLGILLRRPRQVSDVEAEIREIQNLNKPLLSDLNDILAHKEKGEHDSLKTRLSLVVYGK